MKALLVLALICFCFEAIALRSQKITVSGTVKSFDEKQVVLEKAGHEFTVPRKALKTKFKPGDSISVELDIRDTTK